MSDIKTASRWINRWSKIYTDATMAKIKFYLMPREYGKSYAIFARLKRPSILRKFRRLALPEGKHHITCSRKHIKGRGC